MKKIKKLLKRQREDRACDAIIACILRGKDQKFWHEVFRRMDEKERIQEMERHRRHLSNMKSLADNDIYGQSNARPDGK